MRPVHHATVARLAKLGLVVQAVEGSDTMIEIVNAEGTEIVGGHQDDLKDLVAKAVEIVSKPKPQDDADSDGDEGDDENGDDGEGDEGEGDQEGDEAPAEDGGTGSVVKKKYRERYKEIGANDSNGDALAVALREYLTVTGEKKGDAHLALDRLEALADANGLTLPTTGRNPGHTRMIFGNILRGLWKNGKDIIVGEQTIEATPEAKAKAAERFEAEKAKAERKAAPKQTKEERAAKAKAKRQEKAAAKKAAADAAQPTPEPEAEGEGEAEAA